MVAMFAAEKDLKLGVYIYDYAFRRIAQENGEDIKAFVDRHFKLLKDHGTNAIHLTVSDSTGKQYEEIWQPALRKHGIKAYLQLDFAYFLPGKGWTDAYESRQAARAGKFIMKYKKSEGYFSGKRPNLKFKIYKDDEYFIRTVKTASRDKIVNRLFEKIVDIDISKNDIQKAGLFDRVYTTGNDILISGDLIPEYQDYKKKRLALR
jgi:hypothetical protein